MDEKIFPFISEFAARCWMMQASTHHMHLGITDPSSYAAHKALNEIYDMFPDWVDSIVEAAQGVGYDISTMSGSQITFNLPECTSQSAIAMIEDFRSWIEDQMEMLDPEGEEDLPEWDWVENFMQEVLMESASVLYKLKKLM